MSVDTDTDHTIPVTATHVFSLALMIIVSAAWHLHRGYLAFLALGPGGTPQTFLGYLRVAALSILAIRNSYELGAISDADEQEGYLAALPERKGARPQTRGIAPHRQVDQRSDSAMYAALAKAISQLSREGDTLIEATSCFEKHSTGLFCTQPKRSACGGEVCHAHPFDGSMHLTLSLADARLVLTSKWGESHPIARGGWLQRITNVPRGFVMVYAPRNLEEVGTIMRVVKAAQWYVEGGHVERTEAWCEKHGRKDSGYESDTQSSVLR